MHAAWAHAMLQEVQLLGNFIRLADYLLTEGIIERALAGGEDLVAALAAPKLQVRRVLALAGKQWPPKEACISSFSPLGAISSCTVIHSCTPGPAAAVRQGGQASVCHHILL
jgi:hypothetical protein